MSDVMGSVSGSGTHCLVGDIYIYIFDGIAKVVRR